MRALHGEKRGGLREVSLICLATVPGYAQLCTANLRRLPRRLQKSIIMAMHLSLQLIMGRVGAKPRCQRGRHAAFKLIIHIICLDGKQSPREHICYARNLVVASVGICWLTNDKM